MHNVQAGKYHLCRLERRVDGCELPVVRVVDLRREPRSQGAAPAIFSVELAKQMRLRLERAEQVILFLNRRGYARSQQCLACGQAVGCPHCSMTLTYHRKREQLLCHICGHQQRPARVCPECGDPSIRASGFGTERVEAALAEQFPRARVARVDSDTVSRKGHLQEVLDDFKKGRVDILVGTQMIAKGLHFPGVTLVGVLQADLGLQTPDFRAAERVFQLLTQVAGRAGRGDLAGEVVVQAFSPESPAIQFARHQDFDGFAKQEFTMRKAFGYPPFRHAALLLSRSRDAAAGHRVLLDIAQHLKASAEGLGVVVGEAIPCPLEKAHGQFRFQVLLRSASPARIRKLITGGLAAVDIPDGVIVVWDMDPYSLM
jgi:primosomal protein N' (replication factor Y)